MNENRVVVAEFDTEFVNCITLSYFRKKIGLIY